MNSLVTFLCIELVHRPVGAFGDDAGDRMGSLRYCFTDKRYLVSSELRKHESLCGKQRITSYAYLYSDEIAAAQVLNEGVDAFMASRRAFFRILSFPREGRGRHAQR